MKPTKPLVYACAGCSWVARAAYEIAQELDRRGSAEMSCLAGVGARRPAFIKQLDGRETWIIDGCPIDCGRGVFEVSGREPTRHIRLYEFGMKKAQPAPEQVDVVKLAELIAAQCATDETGSAEVLQCTP